MRFLADEGCDPLLLAVLRELGQDVAAVAELAPASTDQAVLAWGLREKRLILHYDLDFGTLIFRDQLPTYGVILVRIPDSQPDLRSTRLQELLQCYDESRLAGSITRLTPKRITMTPIGTQIGNQRRKSAKKPTTIAVLGTQQHADDEIGRNPPSYENWKSYALSFDGESLCRQMGIHPTAWYAQQTRNYKAAGVWNLSLLELRLMLYLEANKAKYNGGVENRAQVESLLAAISEKIN